MSAIINCWSPYVYWKTNNDLGIYVDTSFVNRGVGEQKLAKIKTERGLLIDGKSKLKIFSDKRYFVYNTNLFYITKNVYFLSSLV